jgi:hypothetical protein
MGYWMSCICFLNHYLFAAYQSIAGFLPVPALSDYHPFLQAITQEEKEQQGKEFFTHI